MTSTDGALLLAALATGLLGSTHCVGMCGGISAALSFALPEQARRGVRLFGFQLAYNSGRLLTYTLLGVVTGTLAQGILGPWAHSPWPRMVAGTLMVALGLYLAGWWFGLQRLERLGGSLWRHLEPLRKVILPVDRPWKALVAGGLWGLLPCGLVYSALTLAMARADSLMSGGVMLAFGAGTLPALMVTGTFAGKLRSVLQKAGARQMAGVLVMAFGFWTVVQPLVMKHGIGAHGSHGDHGAMTATPADRKASDIGSNTAPDSSRHVIHDRADAPASNFTQSTVGMAMDPDMPMDHPMPAATESGSGERPSDAMSTDAHHTY
ncbi:MAG TPA: sulfite exporter TauE/SafE family protein [Moraxellaceae bacterium]|nr:sulfite exporter TauE/SafE family protein [Moraxellaceae bacterium]